MILPAQKDTNQNVTGGSAATGPLCDSIYNYTETGFTKKAVVDVLKCKHFRTNVFTICVRIKIHQSRNDPAKC